MIEIISLIIGVPIGFFLFYLLNEIFDVYYFGFKGMLGTLGSCIAVGFGIIYFLLNVAGFLVLPVGGLCLVGWACSRKNKTDKTDEK